jgi:hypothetical protein
MKLSKQKQYNKTRNSKKVNVHKSTYKKYAGSKSKMGIKNRLRNLRVNKQSRKNKVNKGGAEKGAHENNDNQNTKIIHIDESKLTPEEIAKINDFLEKEEYKNVPNKPDVENPGIMSKLSAYVNNPEFMNYLTLNNVFDKFESFESPKKNVKIVFYPSKNKKNSLRKYPYFKVLIEDGNTIYDNIDQVDTMMAYIIDPSIINRDSMFKRSIDINIEDLSKIVEQQIVEANKKNAKKEKDKTNGNGKENEDEDEN